MTLPSVPRSLGEILDPGRTALVVWDMQNGIGARAHGVDECVAKIRDLLGAARAASVLVVYSRHTAPPLELTSAAALRSLMKRQNVADPADAKAFMQAGTADVEIMSAVAPRAGEAVIEKSTPSFFVGTPFELRLRARDIRTIVLAGVATEQGIEMTARHALTLGFFAVVAEDACASFTAAGHEMGLAYLRTAVDVVRTAEIVTAWRG